MGVRMNVEEARFKRWFLNITYQLIDSRRGFD